MTAVRIEAPSRLHFGLFGWGAEAPRQFGGVGLMIEHPGLSISARPAADWSASGPLAERVLRFARQVNEALSNSRTRTAALHFQVHTAAPEHVGLGTGTQLGLAVAALVIEFARRADVRLEELARLVARGRRSGIGLHGFARGGLIVDGGHSADTNAMRDPSPMIPPLLAQLDFPREWNVLLVVPPMAGLHGADEAEAFRRLPPVPRPTCDRICGIVLLGLLPAVAERNLERFGAELEELQAHVGHSFAPAQGGIYARPEFETIARLMRREQLVGVGQSSWGPTLYGFSDGAIEMRTRVAEHVRAELGLDPDRVIWTRANRGGAKKSVPSQTP
jgi:beta-RFAP synthase